MVKAIMHGCNGHMGRVITDIIKNTEGIELVAGVDKYTKVPNDYPVFESIDACDVEADVIIDFSNAAAADELLDYCVEKQVPVVLCTTGLSEEQLDARVLREFDANHNKQFKNAVTGLFPAKLLPVMIHLSGIDPEKKVNVITKEERMNFVHLIKHFTVTLTGLRDFKEAIITRGGVKVKEVNPSTMESKLVQGLYFAGEVLDLDALTGGFNLQIAWSTAFAAGSNIW